MCSLWRAKLSRRIRRLEFYVRSLEACVHSVSIAGCMFPEIDAKLRLHQRDARWEARGESLLWIVVCRLKMEVQGLVRGDTFHKELDESPRG